MASASQACARDWEPGMLLGVHTASSCCIFPGHTSSSPECSRHPPAVSWGRDRSWQDSHRQAGSLNLSLPGVSPSPEGAQIPFWESQEGPSCFFFNGQERC